MREFFAIVSEGAVIMRGSGPEGVSSKQEKEGVTVVTLSKEEARDISNEEILNKLVENT